MVNPLTVVTCVLSVFAVVTAEYDADFCARELGVKETGTVLSKPTFPDNFHLFLERKYEFLKATFDFDQYYSMEHNMAYFMETVAGNPKKEVWLFGKTNELIKGSENDVCEEEILRNSTIANFYDIIDENGQIRLNDPAKALHWNYGIERLDYIGKDLLSDRGIPAMVYKSCEYYEYLDVTSVSTWFFSDNVTMPGRGKEVVLLATETKGNNGNGSIENSMYNIRYDFTRYTTGVEPTDKHFELPAENLCTDRPFAKQSDDSLPTIPGDFFFQGEQVEIDRTGESPYPIIHKTEETFISDFNLTVTRIEEMNGNNPDNAKSIDVEVSDYENGLQYFINVVDGTCDVDIIPADDAAAVDHGNGKLRMRTARGFFDLDSDNYEDMGVHRHIERGIDCDVWSGYFDDTPGHMPKALYTWYFANAEWMAKNNLDYENSFPVQLEVTTSEKIISMNLFEFTRNVVFHLPDVSACFNSKLEKNVRFSLDARYDHVVSPNLLEFRGSLMSSILSVTGLKSVIRISELEFYPYEGATVVEFKMLDKRPEQGDADEHIHIITNKDAITSLELAIDTGKFAVLIQQDVGQIKIDAIKNSFQIIEPGLRPQGTTTVTSGPGGKSPVTPGSGGKSPVTPGSGGKSPVTPGSGGKSPVTPGSGGKSPVTPGSGGKSPVTPGSGGNPENPDANANTGNSDSEMYSAGEMAGLAVGMIVLTAGLIVLALVIAWRLRKPQTEEYVSMDKLES